MPKETWPFWFGMIVGLLIEKIWGESKASKDKRYRSKNREEERDTKAEASDEQKHLSPSLLDCSKEERHIKYFLQEAILDEEISSKIINCKTLDDAASLAKTYGFHFRAEGLAMNRMGYQNIYQWLGSWSWVDNIADTLYDKGWDWRSAIEEFNMESNRCLQADRAYLQQVRAECSEENKIGESKEKLLSEDLYWKLIDEEDWEGIGVLIGGEDGAFSAACVKRVLHDGYRPNLIN